MEPNKVLIDISNGNYLLHENSHFIDTLKTSEKIQVALKNGKLQVIHEGQIIGYFSSLTLKKVEWHSTFNIKPLLPKKASRSYYGNLTLHPKRTSIQLINNVYIEHYVAGVVESESGSHQNAEYYKVQSIICRTYALANRKRHLSQGYNVCDQVHCQVYNGRSRSDSEILNGVKATKGLVIVDHDINLITAGFHSNCGGQTINSEDGWKYPLSYLKSVCDTFCTDMPHATWKRSIPRENWVNYLSKKYNFTIYDSLRYNCAFEHLPEERERYFNYLDSNITTTKIRFDWKLKSAHFYVTENCDSVQFIGNGFGHGIGLCQEGAMKMSQSGYTYSDILHFYYTDVHLIDLRNLSFFRD